MALLMAFLAACGAKDSAGTGGGSAAESAASAAEWSREGYFADEHGNMLTVQKSDMDEYEGWYVGCLLGEEVYGWYIPQEGSVLKGNIVPEYEEGELIVTVSEEGGDGLKFAVEGGKTYHFKPSVLKEAPIGISINTEGYGFFNALTDGDTFETSEDFTSTSVILSLYEPAEYTLTAKGGEGWEFVRWTRNGEDFSEEPEISVEFEESADFLAVFEYSGNEIHIDSGAVIALGYDQDARNYENAAEYMDLFLHGGASEEAMRTGGFTVLRYWDLERFLNDEETGAAFHLPITFDGAMECAAAFRKGGSGEEAAWDVLACAVDFSDPAAAEAYFAGLRDHMAGSSDLFTEQAGGSVRQESADNVACVLGKNVTDSGKEICEGLYWKNKHILMILGTGRGTEKAAETVNAFCAGIGIPSPAEM